MASTDMPAANGADSAPLPLFFTRPVPLDSQRHAKAGLLPPADYKFAAATNSAPVNASEFIDVAKYYPIVFTATDIPMPVAILGLEGQNYFVDAQGAWQPDSYIPAYVRKYPFALSAGAKPDQVILCIDEAIPQFREEGGKDVMPFFDADKKPTPLTQSALEFCVAFDNQYRATLEFGQALKAAELLTPAQSTSKLFNGREIKLGGFQAIDEQKFAALPNDKILEFVKKGWMPLLYFVMMSGSHWNKLANMAGKREPRAA